MTDTLGPLKLSFIQRCPLFRGVGAMSGPRLQLVPAGAPDLVRGDQKDTFYCGHVGSLVSDISHHLLPLRYILRWEREFQLLAEVWYYGLTTVWGNQTLGEEYCNTVQVAPRGSQHRQFSAPSFLRRTTAVLVQVLGPYLVEKTLGWLGQRVGDRNLPLSLSPRQYRMLETGLDFAEDLVSTIHLLHLALFYIQGLFHQFGKRAAGIRYLVVGYKARGNDRSSRLGAYRLLGWLVLGQLAVKLLVWARRLLRLWKSCRRAAEEAGEREESRSTGEGSGVIPWRGTGRRVGLKCPLCLEKCRDVTATRCGHLFCWQCVAQWASDRRECPVCRAQLEPRTLVALQHFTV